MNLENSLLAALKSNSCFIKISSNLSSFSFVHLKASFCLPALSFEINSVSLSESVPDTAPGTILGGCACPLIALGMSYGEEPLSLFAYSLSSASFMRSSACLSLSIWSFSSSANSCWSSLKFFLISFFHSSCSLQALS